MPPFSLMPFTDTTPSKSSNKSLVPGSSSDAVTVNLFSLSRPEPHYRPFHILPPFFYVHPIASHTTLLFTSIRCTVVDH